MHQNSNIILDVLPSRTENQDYILMLQIAGGAALAVGIWLIADKNSFTDLVSQIDTSDTLVRKQIFNILRKVPP